MYVGLFTANPADQSNAGPPLGSEILSTYYARRSAPLARRQETAAMMKRLFTVFECDNGFVAEIGDGGKFGTVVGMNVSEVTAAAQQMLATQALRADAPNESESAKQADAQAQLFNARVQPFSFNPSQASSQAPLGALARGR